MLNFICFGDINVNRDLKREWFADQSFIGKQIGETFKDMI